MRVMLMTTVALAALSLSAVSVAQTSGGSGSSSGSSGGTTVAPQTGSSGGASGGGPGTSGSGAGTSGGAASGTSSGSGAGGTSGGTSGGAASGASGGTSGSGTSSGGAATSGAATGTSGGTAGSTSSSTTVNISGEQRTRAVETLRSVNIRPVQQNVTITVGQTVPTTVTELVDCPTTLESLITGVRDCKVVLVGDRYYIVEGSSRRVVTVIER